MKILSKNRAKYPSKVKKSHPKYKNIIKYVINLTSNLLMTLTSINKTFKDLKRYIRLFYPKIEKIYLTKSFNNYPENYRE